MNYMQYLQEATHAQDSEYYNLIHNKFEQEFEQGNNVMDFSTFKELVDSSDKHYSALGDSQTMKSDSGNFFAKWTETDDMILLHGIVAKTGKINRADMQDIYKWIQQITDKLIDGKQLLTTPHIDSMKMLKHLQKAVEKRGYQYNAEQINAQDIGSRDRLKFKTVKITAT